MKVYGMGSLMIDLVHIAVCDMPMLFATLDEETGVLTAHVFALDDDTVTTPVGFPFGEVMRGYENVDVTVFDYDDDVATLYRLATLMGWGQQPGKARATLQFIVGEPSHISAFLLPAVLE